MKIRRLKKLRSKKGISLIELVVGITIVVIVFSSTLGAMVGGYTTTLYNADDTKAATLNASLNEIIMNTIIDAGVKTKDDLDAQLADSTSPLCCAINDSFPDVQMVPDESITDPATGTDTKLIYLRKPSDGTSGYALASGAVYVPEDFRFCLINDTRADMNGATSLGRDATVDTVETNGVRIITCIESATGSQFYESYVSYAFNTTSGG